MKPQPLQIYCGQRTVSGVYTLRTAVISGKTGKKTMLKGPACLLSRKPTKELFIARGLNCELQRNNYAVYTKVRLT